MGRSAKFTIEPCIFLDPSSNCYEEAMRILLDRFGNEQIIISAHKAELMNGKNIGESIADFELF